MELMNQPFTGQLGDRLIELIDSGNFNTLNVLVAFAKNSGVLRIKDALQRFRKKGGVVNVYVGVDLGGTSYEALTVLLRHTNSLKVVHSEKGQTFHTKIYQFLGKDKGLVVVGSHNLTGGGLWTNFESSILIPVDSSSSDDKFILKGVDTYIGELSSLKDSIMSIETQDDIDNLLKNGYVVKEVAERVRRIKVAVQSGSGERLFGNGAPAKLPGLSKPKKEKVATASVAAAGLLGDDDQTIWLETKLMTGGSRNILDLSMKSLIERGNPVGTSFDLNEPGFMRGGVEFFGLNPADTSAVKDITINFEGIDYEGNTILFPEGKKANGTWRLQIKGVSASKVKITESFKGRDSEHYLVNKLITFTKIRDDYYYMSVFPESELKNFEAASRILARNGSTKNARRLGLF